MIRCSIVSAVRWGLDRGRRVNSATAATPPARYRSSHRYPVGREIPNSAHSVVIPRSLRLAATTNRTRCSPTSILLHAIPTPSYQKARV
jgi:hypothetical protein